MKLKVLVADKFPDKYIQQMKDLDLAVSYQPKLGEKDLPEAAKDVDILISESTYHSELEGKAEEYKHITSQQAAMIASKSNAKKLILTHFSPRYKDSRILLEDAKQIFENTVCAFDFMSVKL